MLLELLPWLVAMGTLMGCSAFFSASEAAIFSLRPSDRRVLANGTRRQRVAAALLQDPERVLSAVLFWNLMVNIAYFALATILEQSLPANSSLVWPLRIGALLLMIFFSEMVPKTAAVLISRQLSTWVGMPMSVLVRCVDPIMPAFHLAMLVSRRLLWPGFQAEETLGMADLERAIELSTSDAKLLEQERTVLRNIVAMSELRADEAMRPRNQLQTFRTPIHLDDLEGSITESGYLLIREPDSDNIIQYVRLQQLWSLHVEHLEATAEPVVYVPWCASMADTFALLQAHDRAVAVVVNEWGDSIGVVTIDDMLDVVFTDKPSRSERLLNVEPIETLGDQLWRATSLTNLRRLERHFDVQLPASHNTTLGGLMHESLERIPVLHDQCQWGPFVFEVVAIDEDGLMTIHLRRPQQEQQ